MNVMLVFILISFIEQVKNSKYDKAKKKICVYGPSTDPNFRPDPKHFMALLVENYLNTIFCSPFVDFDI